MMKEKKVPKELSTRVAPETSKKTYTKPVFTVYGDARDLTLGPTLGTDESGNPATYRLRIG